MRVVHPILAAIVAAGLTFAAAVGVRAEPLKLHQGWVVAGADAPLLMFDNPGGIAKHQGASYALDAIHFSGTPPMITALGAGEIELAALAYSSFALAVQNACMRTLRILRAAFQDGVPRAYTNGAIGVEAPPATTLDNLNDSLAPPPNP